MGGLSGIRQLVEFGVVAVRRLCSGKRPTARVRSALVSVAASSGAIDKKPGVVAGRGWNKPQMMGVVRRASCCLTTRHKARILGVGHGCSTVSQMRELPHLVHP